MGLQVDETLKRSKNLKQTLKAFVLDADGALATTLERYSADRLSHWSATNLQGINRSELAIDMFLAEGQIANQSVIDVFLSSQSNLSQDDQALIQGWKNTFNGLFTVFQVSDHCYGLMNWLTEKRYWVKANGLQSEEELSRLSPGEVVITRLAPDKEDAWTFSGPLMLLGKLGKPKLAVAIGNFKNWFPNYLYGDAPELLEEAWQSVERYHYDFVGFFGSDRLTLSGYELNKQLKEYQDLTTQRRLEEAGIDGSKSLKALVDEAGISEAEVAESVEAFGKDGRAVSRLLKQDQALKMVMPSINLPDELRRAEAITVFVHPRWGQTFLKDYTRLTHLCESTHADALAKLDQKVQAYLKDDQVNTYVWHCLAKENSAPILASLGRCLNRTGLTMPELDDVLVQAGKPLEPKLPDIASVPMHLQSLFQEALQEVNQSSSKKKSKGKRKQKSGFAL